MKKFFSVFLCLIITAAHLTSCAPLNNDLSSITDATANNNNANTSKGESSTPSTELGDDSDIFGDELDSTGIYDGYFEEDSTAVTVECISGTQNAYSLDGTTLSFSGIAEDSVYSISGKLKGNIVIDIPEAYKLELELTGLSLVSTDINPIQALNGDKITITAKKDSVNYIYDMRDTVSEDDKALTKGAIYSCVDLQIGGKGALSVVSENNNGIHSRDDLQVKNLSLTVVCQDNALKGNDSVELTDGVLTLISRAGDGIKTSNSDISSKGKQRGTISISGSNVTVYAACDGLDAAYNAEIDGETTALTVYTDKYSSYSEEVTAVSSSEYYIRFTSQGYKYSVKYYNSDSDYEWVNATYHSTVSGNMNNYYYYSYPIKSEYSKVQFFIYSSNSEQGQEEDYLVASDYLAINSAYDTFALTSRGNSLSYEWTSYTTNIQEGFGGHGGMGGGPGGMNDGNSDKGDHSTKGVKAANEIIINNGTVNIKAYDDSLHADNASNLENGEAALGNIVINGGSIALYSNDDGIHAENAVYINGGNLNIENSYEGIEGLTVDITGGSISVNAKDDGVNSTATQGTGVTLSGGYLYIYCTGDGIDTNSRSSYTGISFEGGNAVIIANSSGNSAIDTEQGYKYSSGSIVAIMPRGGMTSEATHCQSFSSVGSTKTISLTSGGTLNIIGDMTVSITMPCSINNAYAVILNKNTDISS